VGLELLIRVSLLNESQRGTATTGASADGALSKTLKGEDNKCGKLHFVYRPATACVYTCDCGSSIINDTSPTSSIHT